MSTKHTPGNWETVAKREGVYVFALDDSGNMLNQGRYLAECPGLNAEANARLIAAAPELLEIVEAVARFDGRNTGVPARLKEMAIAAIAKVTS